MSHKSGRHFLQIPGPTNVPERILHAISRSTIDHRGPEFEALCRKILDDLKPIFGTTNPVIVFPASGTGAWEAALVNTLSMGDRLLMFETGHFASLWFEMAQALGFDPELIESDWRHGVDPVAIEKRLREDSGHAIKAVAVVHNETSTGVASNIAAVRRAIDAADHPALLLVDTISSLGSIRYEHDDWGVDVTVAGSQKGLMLPPGLGFNAVSDKALRAVEKSTYPKLYWDWNRMIKANESGFFPSTPATNLLFGLREAIDMLNEEGLDNVFRRHARHAEATRRAVRAWGFDIVCANPEEYSSSLTAVLTPGDVDPDGLRRLILEDFDMSLGAGLSKLSGKAFRIGHLGHFNDLSLAGTLSGIEMGFTRARIEYKPGGVQAALDYLAENSDP